jgi:aerobic-type carbon monoxide dehydrogenase small subunit (CoxS/CutS family)
MQDSANEASSAVSVSYPAKSVITLTVNGTVQRLEVAPWTTLLDLLPECLELTGTKKGVTMANAERVRSCSMASASIHVLRWRSCTTAQP